MTKVYIKVENKQIKRAFLIQYLVKFKNYTKMQALINSDGKVNAITQAYPAVLELYVCFIDIRA